MTAFLEWMATAWATITAFFAAYPVCAYVLRVMVATICGAIIGLERTKRSKEAGIRTHCIIACGAALLMVISKYGFVDMLTEMGELFPGMRGADPSRIASQVVSGISFLGAGVIFKNGNTVKGLTTAAGIWATAAVGLACGSGMYAMALFVTILIVVVQMLMHKFSIGNDAYSNEEIRISMVDSPEIRAVLREKQEQFGIEIYSSKITAGADGTLDLVLQVRLKRKIGFDQIMRFIDEHPDIKSMSI